MRPVLAWLLALGLLVFVAVPASAQSISSVSPGTFVAQAGGATITLNGSGFTPGGTVGYSNTVVVNGYFGSASFSPNVLNDSQMQIGLPSYISNRAGGYTVYINQSRTYTYTYSCGFFGTSTCVGYNTYYYQSNQASFTVIGTTSVTLSVADDTVRAGTTALLSAGISGSDPYPTGTIRFIDSATNQTLGSPITIGGVSTQNVLLTNAGARQIYALYSGDAYHPASASPVKTVTVTPTAGRLAGWGDGARLELGANAAGNPNPTPVTINGLTNVVSVGTGDGFTVALRADGTVWSWGTNTWGALGIGSGNQAYATTTPLQVGLTNVVALAVGYHHAVAIRYVNGTSTVYAWGDGQNAQLGTFGYGGGYYIPSPTPVQGLPNKSYVAVAAGVTHSVLLAGDGTVYAWGLSNLGQVGVGGGLYPGPNLVPLPFIKTIAAGAYHTLALATDGRLYSWGYNAYGQLGTGNFATSYSPVVTNVYATAIAGGTYHSVALQTDGTVRTFGYGANGELGTGDFSNSPTPVTLITSAFVPLTDVTEISANAAGTSALRSDGTVWSSGFNKYGALGTGVASPDPSPVALQNISPAFFLALSSGGNGGQNAAIFTDTAAPTLSLPADLTAEATGPSGASVTFTATAADAIDGARPVTCTPASGSTFPLGPTTVHCSASDSSGNTTTGTFTVTVVDTTPPTVTILGSDPLTIYAGTPFVQSGATASDLVDGNLTASVVVSGAVNTNVVDTYLLTYTATDQAGNTGSATRIVNVVSAATTTNLVSGPDPSPFAQQVIFTATVTSSLGAVTQGTVTFREGQQILAANVPLDGSGQATWSISNLSPGSHTITADYSGAIGADPSSASVTQIVQATPTVEIHVGTFTFDGNPHPAQATVTGINGNPVAGTLTLTYAPGGATPPVNVGSYSVTASFTSGDVGYTDSTVTLPVSAGGGTWSARAPLPTARYGPGVAAINGKIYVASGCCIPFGIVRFNTLEVYDPANDSWASRAPIPIPIYGGGTAAINGLLYVAGGHREASNTNVLQVYNPGTNTWTQNAPMPDSSGGSVAGVLGNMLYVAGGMNASNTQPVNTLRRYDPATNTWQIKAPMASARDLAAAAVLNNKLYVAGGYDATGHPMASVEVYDPASDTWSPLAPMPSARYLATAQFIDGRLFVVGGNIGIGGANIPIDTVEVFDPATNTWATRAPASTTSSAAGSALVNGTMYVIGGLAADQTNVARNDAFTPDALLRITPSAPLVSLTGGTFSYDHSSHPATGTATGVFAEAVPGIFTFTYSPGGSSVPFNAGSYNVTGTFVSSDPNYADGSATTSIVITAVPASIAVPGDITVEAVSPAPGSRQVFFTVNASDSDGPLMPTCSPASGYTFPMGTTTVTCTAQGTNSTQASASFTVTVEDTTKPNVNTPNDQTWEATGPGGRIVTFTATANDNIDGSLSATCAPASGSLFPLATTTVTCSATDSHGNTGSRSFKITVRDTIAPQIQQLSGITTFATSPEGAVVNFALPTAVDTVDPQPTVTTNPASGSIFPHGNTQVIVTAKDFSNNTRTASFVVHVSPSLVWIETTADDGGSSATINVSQTKQFVAIGHFTDGSTKSTADTGGDNGGGTGGSGGGGGSSSPTPYWNVHFSPGLNVGACGTPVTFSSQAFSVDANGQITNTQWSPNTPAVNVTGQLVPNGQVTMTVTCINNPAISSTATLAWSGTSFDGQITFSGVASTAHVTGWASQPSMPTAAASSGAAVLGSRLYVVGGGVNFAPSNLVQVFNLTTRNWEAPAAPLLTAVEGPGVAALNGFVYAAGGHTPGGNATNALQRYDPAANQWTALAPMSVARAELQLVAAGGMLYALGGQPGNGQQPALTTVERYDPATDTWATLAPMTTPRMFFTAGVLNGATIVAVGSDLSGGSGPSVELYTIASNQWTAGASLPIGTSGGGAIANRLYVATLCGTFAYRPAGNNQTDGWAMLPFMLHPRSQMATAVDGDVLYAAGGFTGSGQTSVLQNTFDTLSTPGPTDLFYSPSFNLNCQSGGGSNGGGGGGGGDQGPSWRIGDLQTGMDSPVASIDGAGLATGLAPGTAFAVAEYNGISCLDTMTCASLTVDKYTPAFSGLASQTIPYGTGAVTVSGHIEAPGPNYPAGDAVTIAVSSVSATATVDANGNFAGSLDTHAIPVGTYQVTYTYSGSVTFYGATDGSTTVTVTDTTPPVLQLPANIVTDAVSPSGAAVMFTATALDAVDGPRPVSCAPAPGSTFPVGDTTVSCSSSDTHGNTATGSFTVHVRSAAEMAQILAGLAAADGMQQSANLLAKVLQSASGGAVNGNAACNDLGAFINQVNASNKLTAAQKADLLTEATHVGATLGCR